MWNNQNTRFLSTRSILKRRDEMAVIQTAGWGVAGKAVYPARQSILIVTYHEDKRIVIDLLAIAA